MTTRRYITGPKGDTGPAGPPGTGGTFDGDAGDINIVDTGDYYTGTDVEAALQEVGADLAALPAQFQPLAAVLTNTTASYTTAEASKLAGIEAGADVTDTTNVDAAGAVMESDTSTSSMSFVIDEDSMSSNSATKVPTQQSVKAYVDASGGGGSNPAFGKFDLAWLGPPAETTPFGSSVNRLYVVPIFVPDGGLSFSHIAINVTSAATAGGLARLGVYEDSSGFPGALELDAGTVATDSTGIKSITLGSNLTLAAGRWWMALETSVAAASFTGVVASSAPFGVSWYTYATTIAIAGLNRTVTPSGALPDPGGSFAGGPATTGPMVWLRLA